MHAAAALLGYKTPYTRRLCQDGVLRATKPGGRDWLIPRTEIERFQATQAARKRGPKPRKRAATT